MDTQGLRHAVAVEFATTGAETPPWPDPHPECGDPLEEEYSRCFDPGKYRILRARADAWVNALIGFGLATFEEVEAPAAAWWDELDIPIDTVVRLRPLRAGTISLLLAFGSMDGVRDAVVIVGAGEPTVQLVTLPDCGCDACDSGSEYLLEEFDEHLLAVVSGEFVHVTTKKGTRVTATGSGWSADGMTARKVEKVLADARAGRSPHRVVQGLSWA